MGKFFGESASANPYTKQTAAAADQLKGMYGDQGAANQQVMADLMAGRTAQIDEASYKSNYVDPMMKTFNKVTNPAIKAATGNNYWSSQRIANQQAAGENLNQQLLQAWMNMENQVRQGQLQGMGMQQSALQGALDGYSAAAQSWKPKEGFLDYANQVAQFSSNVAGTGLMGTKMYANVKGTK